MASDAQAFSSIPKSSKAFTSSTSLHMSATASKTLSVGKKTELPSETEVIVIGSGLAGLSCASLLAHNEVNTCVLESHDTTGGWYVYSFLKFVIE